MFMKNDPSRYKPEWVAPNPDELPGVRKNPLFFPLRAEKYGLNIWMVDKAIGVQWSFRLNSVLIGFVALRSEYASILRSGRRAAKKRCLPKIFDLKREDFFVLEVEERSNTVVL